MFIILPPCFQCNQHLATARRTVTRLHHIGQLAALLPSVKVGVNLGWRKIDNTIRVAYWVDEDGRHGELLLCDRDIITHFFKISDLQSIRDNHFNDAKATLSLVYDRKPNTGVAEKWRLQA